MMGLWVAIATNQHPLAYDPSVGPVTPGARWEIGAIVAFHEGEESPVPEAGSERLGGKHYRWQWYAGKTVDDVLAYLPMGVPKDAEHLKGGLRLKEDSDPMIRPGSDLGLDIKFNGDPR